MTSPWGRCTCRGHCPSIAPGLRSGDIWPKAANSKWQMGELREDAALPPSSANQARGASPGGGCTHSQVTPCPAQAGLSGPTPSGPRRGVNSQGLHTVPGPWDTAMGGLRLQPASPWPLGVGVWPRLWSAQKLGVDTGAGRGQWCLPTSGAAGLLPSLC